MNEEMRVSGGEQADEPGVGDIQEELVSALKYCHRFLRSFRSREDNILKPEDFFQIGLAAGIIARALKDAGIENE